MKKFGSKRELIGLVIVLVLAAAGFAFFAWYTMRPVDTIGTIATISPGCHRAVADAGDGCWPGRGTGCTLSYSKDR